MWSPQQEKALSSVERWIKSKNKQVFRLDGYAGTGKTTLAKHFASMVSGQVYFAALTGKAAHVLEKSGANNVSTIHKLIYVPKNKSQQRLQELQKEYRDLTKTDPQPLNLIKKLEREIQQEQKNLVRPSFQLNLDSPLRTAALLIVDEYYMIGEEMGADLVSFDCPILALGDPAQLPPIYGRSFFKGDPDVQLTEIHRQAKDNPIIWLAKEVREGRKIKPGRYGESRVMGSSDISREELGQVVLNTNQLLVGKNRTRVSSNFRARELKEIGSDLPVAGDKLVCLRNNREIGLLNGQIWYSTENAVLDPDGKGHIMLSLREEDTDRPTKVSAHACYFRGAKPDFWGIKDAEEFDYGYALTVHKAQGSQWRSVLLFDEWYMQDRKNWLYTAITRAAEKIDIIQY